jgi:hypothetical protein
MKIVTVFSAAVLLLLSATGSQAQVDYSDIKIGTQLDGKGIKIGMFIKPVPLPAGDWLVVARQDEQLPLSGSRELGGTSTSLVSLTLKSRDAGNGIGALLLSFAPDSVAVLWGAGQCATEGQAIVVELKGSNIRAANGCATAQFMGPGFKEFIADIDKSSNASAKAGFGGLQPYAQSMPDQTVMLAMNARRDGGRLLKYRVFANMPADFKPGDPFEATLKTWMTASTQAMVDMLGNDLTPMAAYPAVP